MDSDSELPPDDVSLYSQERIHQMVIKKYKALRANGNLESITDIYIQLPQQRLKKQQYGFTFDIIKNNVQQKMNESNKLQKALQNELLKIKDIQIRNSKDVLFENADQLYSQKLISGLPIFKSIQFLRYQDNLTFQEYFGEQKAFIVDQQNIEFGQIKHDIGKIKLFVEIQKNLPKVNVEFKNINTLNIKYQRYPTLLEVQKRADAMAKLLLYNIFAQQHRKLKQIWKNDPRYQNMQRNEKKNNSQMQGEKVKEDPFTQDGILQAQVQKVLRGIEQRANLLAHDHFRQLNSQKAVQTKKSLQKLKYLIQSQPNPKIKLRNLIAYKQKKNW